MTTGRNWSWGKFARQAWLCAWASIALVLWAWSASAAHVYAPMCDDSAASVPAPLPAPPSSDGEIAELGCDWVFGGERVHPGLPETPHNNVPPALQNALAVLQPVDVSVPSASAVTNLWSVLLVAPTAEHRVGIFRPPCALRG